METSAEDSDFKSVLNKEREAIQSAIDSHGPTALLEDKSLDLIAAIVHDKIADFTGKKSSNVKKSGGATPTGLVQFLVSLLTMIFMIIMICTVLGFKVDFGTHEANKEGSIIVGPFEFKSGSQIASSSFFGKKDLFDLWEGRMLDSIKKIADKPKNILDRLAIYQKLNFVLFGPPGTGKTLFVQTLATRVDFELKKMHLKETDQDRYDMMRKKPEDEFIEYINKTPSRIAFCEVQPSMINNMYVGQSEQNAALLFDSVKDLLNEKWKVVILFFDEGDVFFAKRTPESPFSSPSSGNVKSEFLTRIGVRPTGKYYPLFVFTASNRMEEFDDAFKRRFANQEEFGFPNTEERKLFVKFLLKGFDITEDEIALVVNYTEMKSYSYIAEKMKLFMVADDDGELIQINFKRYIDFLKRNHHNRNMV